ncbi:uncharacterized protein LOC127250439 [Andrographis paniculata]|uniref:uncharacterized protein LOC127250439 n=1 Tax=Andrographis paniculata TaxID=175694 RepID=UPI0021E8851F|nr:uncharacterized protein LOC127250439 [Andrographis paniculata]
MPPKTRSSGPPSPPPPPPPTGPTVETRGAAAKRKSIAEDAAEIHDISDDSLKHLPPKKRKKTSASNSEASTSGTATASTSSAAVESAPAAAAPAGDARSIIIEHGQEIRTFKAKATRIENGLKIAIPGIAVQRNPVGPVQKSFRIREAVAGDGDAGDDGQTFLSLMAMEPPFQPLKDLNVEEVVADIVEKLQL